MITVIRKKYLAHVWDSVLSMCYVTVWYMFTCCTLYVPLFSFFTAASIMTTEKAANPVEPFLLLLKDAKGAGAASVLNQAMGAPNVYVFGEFLDLPNVQEVDFCSLSDTEITKTVFLFMSFAVFPQFGFHWFLFLFFFLSCNKFFKISLRSYSHVIVYTHQCSPYLIHMSLFIHHCSPYLISFMTFMYLLHPHLECSVCLALLHFWLISRRLFLYECFHWFWY